MGTIALLDIFTISCLVESKTGSEKGNCVVYCPAGMEYFIVQIPHLLADSAPSASARSNSHPSSRSFDEVTARQGVNDMIFDGCLSISTSEIDLSYLLVGSLYLILSSHLISLAKAIIK